MKQFMFSIDSEKGMIFVITDRKIEETTSSIVVTNSIKVMIPPVLRDKIDEISNLLFSPMLLTAREEKK